MKTLTANELRIGNYVGYGALHTGVGGHDHYTVKEITENCAFFRESNVGEYHKDINPIPLTEEWLVKFGFISEGLSGFRFALSNVISWCGEINDFAIEYDGEYFYPMAGHTYVCFHEIKYVHQLQNLFFALTGEELPFNRNPTHQSNV